MIFETITSPKFPETYKSLTKNLEADSFFFSQLWFDTFLQTVTSKHDTIIWFGCKTDKGEPLLLWPLWKHLPKNRFFQPTRITGLANFYTTLYEPLHVISDDDTLKTIITNTAQKICQQSWNYIDLYPLNPKSRSYPFILKAFQQRHKHVQPYFMYGNWFLLTAGQSFKEYYSMRPSRIKNTIKRRLNKLKKHTIEYRIYTKPNEFKFGLQQFQIIYSHSWKKSEPYPDFMPSIVEAATKQGWLRLGLLLIDQEVVAAQIWFTLHQTAYIYKLCHHPKFSMYSPGTLLSIHLMEYAIDVDKVQKVDFLSGDDNYKKDWMSHRDERWGLQISNPKSFFGMLQLSKNIISLFFKKTINQFSRL